MRKNAETFYYSLLNAGSEQRYPNQRKCSGISLCSPWSLQSWCQNHSVISSPCSKVSQISSQIVHLCPFYGFKINPNYLLKSHQEPVEETLKKVNIINELLYAIRCEIGKFECILLQK